MERARVAVVAGASGFVGAALVSALDEEGYAIRRIGRTEAVTWEDPAGLAGTRRVALRMAIVLGDGPAPDVLWRLARLGLGSPQTETLTAAGYRLVRPSLDESV